MILGDRYETKEVIGRGGMATVYRGTDSVLGRTVAIKILSSQYAEDPEFVARFRREAQSAAKLSHPNVVPVFDTGSDGGTNFIVMEYIEGRTLAEILVQDGQLLPERAIEIAEAVCQALSFAHEQGIVHRDIKTGNIMITKTGEVKVMDFGIAGAISQDTVAQTATVMGTASYLSPEQAQGRSVDQRSDIYSLGVVLFEMLTGRPPFAGDSAVSVAVQHVQENPPRPSELAPGIPPDLDAVVLRTLAKNPENRYASAEDFRQDLERCRLGMPVAATPLLDAPTQVIGRAERTAVAPPVEEGTSSSTKWAIGIIVALILIGLAILAWLLFFNDGGGGRESPTPTPVPKVSVPDLKGFTEDEATAALAERGLKVGDTTREPSDEQPGTVISQKPKPGDELKKGGSVDIVLAAPPSTVAVPDVTNLSESQASQEIENAGLAVGGTEQKFSSTVPEGNVIKTRPPANEEVARGSSVALIVSSGGVIVPDLECASESHAANKLNKIDLELSVVDPPVDNPSCTGPGKVATQDPAAGTEVPPGSTVEVQLTP